ncbi:hypothetical protein, partial [Sulfuriflexus sp.]|uniref:hypothetical protein n=1 Tax=Sulfuriflexus sp. TaxID=2015443 RepID=UPI0028CECA06
GVIESKSPHPNPLPKGEGINGTAVIKIKDMTATEDASAPELVFHLENETGQLRAHLQPDKNSLVYSTIEFPQQLQASEYADFFVLAEPCRAANKRRCRPRFVSGCAIISIVVQ